MPDQPRDALTNLLGEMAERAGKYTEVLQNAATQNAAQQYNADAAIGDFQKLFTMALRDMAEMGAAMIEALSSAVPRPPDA